MQPTLTVEGKVPNYWQAEMSEHYSNDQSWVVRVYITDPELIKKINAGSLIGLSIGKGFQEGSAQHFTLRERIVRLRQDIGFKLELFGCWLQR